MKHLGLHLPTLPWSHWAVSVLAAGAGCVSVWWWGAPSLAAWDALEAEVVQLEAVSGQQGVARSTPVVAAASLLAGSVLPDWPTPDEAASVWPWLQQRLQAQGLQVLAIQPLPLNKGNTARALHEQAVQWRLQGHWRDWLAWGQALEAHAPWWVFDRWLVLPAGTPGQVRIELQALLGLQEQHSAAARVWPTWPVSQAAVQGVGAEVFDPPGARAESGPVIPVSQGQPREWPVRELRLLGIWQQAGVRHAVLGAGPDWLVVSPGQWVGRERYRVLRVSASGLDLGAALAADPPLHLGFQGEPR